MIYRFSNAVQVIDAQSLCGKRHSFGIFRSDKSPSVLHASNEAEWRTWFTQLSRAAANQLHSSTSTALSEDAMLSTLEAVSNNHTFLKIAMKNIKTCC